MRSNRGCECFYDFLCRVKAERSFVCFHPCSPGEAQFICNKPAVYEISSPRLFRCSYSAKSLSVQPEFRAAQDDWLKEIQPE